jgi:hypothetical protein
MPPPSDIPKTSHTDGNTSRTARDTGVAAGAYALLTLVLTWPLARSLTRELPADLGDPLLNSWILAWDCEHLLRALAGQLGALREYWHANIYYPHPLALAYSEHLTAQAVMVLPVYAIAKNPILAYNVAFLATFVLAALGMFLFVRELTGSRSAAFLAGVAYGFAPYRFGAVAPPGVVSMWMPFGGSASTASRHAPRGARGACWPGSPRTCRAATTAVLHAGDGHLSRLGDDRRGSGPTAGGFS